ncbi:MAG: substrate-binding domain-containing protein [Candidatus Omnitrophota bacterium]|nr:substrate-binding domain-containing protein [Candidatus Omnitrophota bacterium]
MRGDKSGAPIRTIGIVLPFRAEAARSPYFEELIAGVLEGLRPHSGWDLKWLPVRDREQKQITFKSLLERHRVDGIIFFIWRHLPRIVSEMMKAKLLPAVLVNDHDKTIRNSILYCENETAIFTLLEKLRRKGYRRFGMIRGPESGSRDAKARYEAFKHGLRRLKLTYDPAFTYESSHFSERLPHDIMKSLITAAARPEVILCANDDIAHGAIRILRRHKIHVPAEIAVAGFDDSPVNEVMSPTLTSVRQPTAAMGKKAVEILLGIISGKLRRAAQIKFKPEVILRESA